MSGLGTSKRLQLGGGSGSGCTVAVRQTAARASCLGRAMPHSRGPAGARPARPAAVARGVCCGAGDACRGVPGFFLFPQAAFRRTPRRRGARSGPGGLRQGPPPQNTLHGEMAERAPPGHGPACCCVRLGAARPSPRAMHALICVRVRLLSVSTSVDSRWASPGESTRKIPPVL